MGGFVMDGDLVVNTMIVWWEFFPDTCAVVARRHLV